MANARRPYNQAEQVFLNTQVGGYCPLCDAPLFYKKGRQMYKAYELAHIYPLNPSSAEVAELANVPLLHADVNHPDNIIPLCQSCHAKYDKPRTRKEYLELFALKQRLIEAQHQRQLASQYPLESQIAVIISRLHGFAVVDQGGQGDLVFDPKRLIDKFNTTLPGPTQRKIKHAVADYYQYIKAAFGEMEKADPTSSELIFTQVRAFYLKQKAQGLPQGAVFGNVVNWVRMATGAETLESAEIVASFFVQNCEVFD